MTRWCYSAS